MLAVLLNVAAFAQGEVPAFCLATDPADPDYDITDFDPARDSDDWCKLAYHQPHKARRQLSKAVALVRTENNPNRYYFDPKWGSPPGLYIQLLRPWMAEQNAAGTADWRVIQYGYLDSETYLHRLVEGGGRVQVVDRMADRWYRIRFNLWEPHPGREAGGWMRLDSFQQNEFGNYGSAWGCEHPTKRPLSAFVDDFHRIIDLLNGNQSALREHQDYCLNPEGGEQEY